MWLASEEGPKKKGSKKKEASFRLKRKMVQLKSRLAMPFGSLLMFSLLAQVPSLSLS